MVGWLGTGGAGRASLEDYDAAVALDVVGGLVPTARLTAPVIFTGGNKAAFDFGAVAGSATMEFILEGDPTAGSSYLAVGANTASNLRFAQWPGTGQLGFTQLGVRDYVFTPLVASPTQTTHVAYVWNEAARTMNLYRNGVLAGTAVGVTETFAMPTGQGWLGANPGGTEAMIGTVHRATIYADIVAEEVIQSHADAFAGVVRPPVIVSFAASPEAVFVPGSTTLRWEVLGATGLWVDDREVTGWSALTVGPVLTTTYTLIATNSGGSTQARVTVQVNPPAVIRRFALNRAYAAKGETVMLDWETRYAEGLSILPGVGDVAPLTSGGFGSVAVQAVASRRYTLTASNSFGLDAASVDLHLLEPAAHLVISEFLADDQTTLADEDGAYSGWIEIYNPTEAAVDLRGYYLTDDAARPFRWAFPGAILGAGTYRVVFASGKDRAGATGAWHTNFRLKNGGEFLALVGPGPVWVHAFEPAYPPQRPDISYGILAGDPAVTRFFGVPTPGAPNDETPAPPPPVEFSVPDGMFTEPFTVTLTVGDPAAEIRFTTDGSAPGSTHGARYVEPLRISQSTHVRAVAVVAGLASSVRGACYIKLGADLANYTSPLPILVIENFGAGTIGQKGWNGNGAGLKQVPRQTAVWAVFERADGPAALTNAPQEVHLIGIRGRGAYSTEWRQKPYSVEAMDEMGEEVQVSPLGLPAHADWVLYYPDADPSRDPTLLFNTFAYDLSRRMGDYAVRFRWVEAFINEDGGDLGLADRRGVYALIERVARGSERLNFQRLSADGSTGGWLLNINRMDPEPETGWPAPNGAVQPWFFHTAGPDRVIQTSPDTAYGTVPGDDQPQQPNAFINFDNPNGYVVNRVQRAAIEGWFRQFEDVLYSDAIWRHPTEGYRRLIDTADFIDYFILNTLTRNGDGLLISMYPWKGDDGKLRMGPAWDYNWSSYYVSGPPTGSLLHRSDRLWYARLFADPDFKQAYIDRWWVLRRGPLANASLAGIIDAQAAEITLEKALLNGLASANEWFDRLAQMKAWLQQRADWIDGNYLRPPALNRDGGEVPAGFLVSITGTTGTLYVTTDGTDPRAAGGAVAATAQAYTGAFPILAPTLVQARLRNGTTWSGLTSTLFTTPQDLESLVVTEIMYRPPAAGGWGSDDLEFLELRNTGAQALELGGLQFDRGITFGFPVGAELGPGEFWVLASHREAFASQHPGVTVDGVYSGHLDNGGETLRLVTPEGTPVIEITYGDRAPWPLAADGYGFSLVPGDPTSSGDDGSGWRWRASSAKGGSPGGDDPAPDVVPVLVNEVLTRTTPPAVDAVELFNPTDRDADLSGWFLSDDGANPRKYRFPPGTTLRAGEFLVVTEADFNPVPPTLLNFALDAAGDSIYLVAGDGLGELTGYSHGFDFGAAPAGVSFGRFTNSVGEERFALQSAVSLGGPNPGPAVGPVVISEIQYAASTVGDEFVELRNVTDQPVPLFDPAHRTNTWRLDGLGFVFPTNVVVPPQGWLVLVATNAGAFRTRMAVPESVPILSLDRTSLGIAGVTLRLGSPDFPDADVIPYVTVDEVLYGTRAPWPPEANGGGASLQRATPGAYGSDPAHWIAAMPTPGRDRADSAGAPRILAIDPPSSANGGGFTLRFLADGGRAYAVESSDSLAPGSWQRLADVPARPLTRAESIFDPGPRATRFYRLVTSTVP